MSNENWKRQHDSRFETTVDLIPKDFESLLDVGAKPYTLFEYLPKGPEYHAINLGEDSNPHTTLVEGKSVVAKECNVEEDRWPYAEDEMDVVVMGAIIEHLFDPLAALQEARRVLSPEGTLVLTTPNATRLLKRIAMVLGRNPWDGYAANRYHRHNHEWTHSELRDILDVAGLEITSEEFITLNRTGLLGAIEMASRLYTGWSDQFVIAATPGKPNNKNPDVYRDSLIERERSETSIPS